MGWGVEVLVGDAVDVPVLDGLKVVPVALGYDAFERDSVPCSAPAEEQDVGVGCGDGLWGGLSAGSA